MSTTIPGPHPIAALGGIARRGFLAETGRLWRTHGDTFALRLGVGDMVVAVHPDSVRDVQLTQRRSFDKRASYDGVRRYLTGEGLIASTGELWKRQRKLMAPFFTPKGVLAYAQIILDDADRVVDRWAGLAASGQVVEDIPAGKEQIEVGPYPRILDTGCDYAAVGSVAARRAS